MYLFLAEKKTDGILFLATEELYHLSKVLRFHIGDEVYFTNGKGDLWRGSIRMISQSRAEAEILVHFPEYGKYINRIHMAVSLTRRRDSFEWFLEKATELGVDEITPLICKRSHYIRFSYTRAIKIISSSVKQSIRAYMPLLNSEVNYNEFIFLKINIYTQYLIAHCQENLPRGYFKEKIDFQMKNYIVLIGPEGDFSYSEIQKALSRGWQGVSLGEFRLRVETAALSALHTVRFLNK